MARPTTPEQTAKETRETVKDINEKKRELYRQLLRAGLSAEEAQAEVDAIYAPALTTGYGTLAEKEGILPVAPPQQLPPEKVGEPTVWTSMLPQQVYTETVRQMQEPPPKLLKAFDEVVEETGKTKAEVQAELSLLAEGMPNLKEQLGRGPEDPLYQALSRQVNIGEVPYLTPLQMKYVSKIAKSDFDKEYQNQLEQVKEQAHNYVAVEFENGKKVKVPKEVYDYLNETVLPPSIYRGDADKKIMEGSESFFTELKETSERNAEAIATVRAYKAIKEKGQTAGDEWWLDEKKREMVLADPEAYTKGLNIAGLPRTTGGILFSKTTPFGGTRESTASWALRAITAPENLVAGAVVEAGVQLLPEEAQKKRAEQRAEKTPLYKDTAILANIAEGKGATVEAMEIADAMGIENPVARTVIGATGLGFDVLNPTMGLAAAAAGATKAGAGIYRGTKAIYGAADAGQALKATVAAGTAEFLDDFNGISLLAKSSSKKVRDFSKTAMHGDVRLHLASDLANGLEAKAIVDKAADLDSALQQIAERGLQNTTYVRQLKKEAEATDFITARKALDEQLSSIPTLKTSVREMKDTLRYIDEATVGKPVRKGKMLNAELLQGVLPKGTKLTPAAAELAKKKIRTFYARQAVIEATPNINSLEGVVALTRNTFAHKSVKDKILAESTRTEAGQVLNDVSRGKQTTGMKPSIEVDTPFGAVVVPSRREEYFLVPEEKKERLIETINNSNITPTRKAQIIETVNDGKLFFSDYTNLLSSNVDQTAKGLQEGIVTADEAGLLPAAQQERLLEAQETVQRRAPTGVFGDVVGIVKDVYSSVATKLLKKQNTVSAPRAVREANIHQRRLVKEIQQECSALDQSLRREIYAITGQEDVLATYTDNLEEITREDAMGLAIVGTMQEGTARGAQLEALHDALAWSFRRIFYAAGDVEMLGDRVLGLQKMYDNNILSPAGVRALDESITELSEKMIQNPREFWGLYDEWVSTWDDALRTNSIDGVVPFDPMKIADARSAMAKLDSVKSNIGIGMYYFSERGRIINTKLANIVEQEMLPTAVQDILPGVQITQDQFTELTKYALRLGYNNSQDSVRIFDALMNSIENEDAARAAMTYADMVKRNRGLGDNLPMGVTDVRMFIDDVFGVGNENFGRLVFGEEFWNSINSQIKEGKLSQLTEALDKVVRTEANTARGWLAVKKYSRILNNIRYTCLLTMRPRFHFVNMLTATAIMYTTIGKGVSPGSYADALKVVSSGSSKGLAGFSEKVSSLVDFSKEIAVRDPAGRVYTYGQIYETLRTSGIRTEYSWLTSAVDDGSLVAFLKKNNGRKQGFGQNMLDGIARVSDGLGEIVMAEDLVFRAGAMIDALKEGRSIEEAVALARRSLFDYNDMTAAEKAASAYFFIFYNFVRQNTTAFIRSMFHTPTMKRYLNLLKFDRGVEALTAEMNDKKAFPHRVFFPDYTLSRQILSVQEGQEKDYYNMGPPIPGIDAMLMALDIAQLKIPELVTKQLHPDIKLLLQLQEKFGVTRVPSEYISLLSIGYSGDPEKIAGLLEKVVGGQVLYKPASSEKGGVGGYIYPLDDKQQKSWKAFARYAIEYPGLGTMSRDWIKMFAPEGTSQEQLTMEGRALTALGIYTPMRILKPEIQELKTIEARKAELGKKSSAAKKTKER
jgi:hypothetical protein